MIQSSVEFFRNLPAKQCTECGEKFEEQRECYGNTCDHCLADKVITGSPSDPIPQQKNDPFRNRFFVCLFFRHVTYTRITFLMFHDKVNQCQHHKSNCIAD